jgi:predicted transcriptional regulator
VATVVYRRGACTAKDVQKRLSGDISNGAVRSMLVRLVGKGILARRSGKRGRTHEFVYLPVITTHDVKCAAVQRLTDDHFGGSLLSLALVLVELLDSRDRRPDSIVPSHRFNLAA